MSKGKKVDVAIHGSIDVVVKGIPEDAVATTVRRMKKKGGSSIKINVKGIKDIDILNPDGSVNQTVFGNKDRL